MTHKDGFCLYKIAAGHDAHDPIFEKLCAWSSWFSYDDAMAAVFKTGENRRRMDGLWVPARPKYRRQADLSDGNWVASDYEKLPEDLYFAIPVELYVELTVPETNELGEVHP